MKLKYISIKSFYEYDKENNDLNEIRESIIVNIINNKIPEWYYKNSYEWKNLQNEINNYIDSIKKNDIKIISLKCIPRGGRRFHYDFEIIINEIHNYNIEFKFNATCVNETPQFVSPGKPSRFIKPESPPFESWFYDNYLPDIAKKGNLYMPEKNTYIKNIGNNKVTCMIDFKTKYKKDKTFEDYCKKKDKQAIKKYIKMVELDTDKLSKYLVESQQKKFYMCFKDNKIYKDTINEDMFKILDLTNTSCYSSVWDSIGMKKICNPIYKEPTNFIVTTKKGYKLQIKLRFKNGCGLLYPAFQIKRKVPNKKYLVELCKKNNLPYKMSKKKFKCV